MSSNIIIQVKNSPDMGAYVAIPEGKGPFPAVMVFQEAYGVNHHIKRVTDLLAAEGYLAIAPELFHRTAPLGYDPGYGDFSLVMPHFQALNTELILDDIKATYAWLMQQDNVQKDKIGCIGWCLGGRVAFLANSAVQLSASVSFYGGYTHTVAERAASLSAPQLFFWGGKDKHILPEHVQVVIDAVSKAGKDYINVVISYADHAFFCDERPSYHREATKEAWGMTTAFFKNKLG